MIVEGPHDRASLETLALRLQGEEGTSIPSALGVTIIDAGAYGSGGSSAIPHLARAARDLGFRTVTIIDYDKDGIQTEKELEENVGSADVVIRLPKGQAIELALLSGLSDDVIRTALKELNVAFGLILPADVDSLSDKELLKAARKAIKHAGGLHAQFTAALPKGMFPTVAKAILRKALEVAIDDSKGLVQL